MRRSSTQFLTVEAQGTGGGLVEAAQNVEERRFTGTVGANNGVDQAFGGVEADASQRHDAAETLFEAFDLEQG